MCVTLCDFYAMQRDSARKGSQDKVSHAPSFKPVFDSRKRKVKGLVTRNGRFYAQMRVPVASGASKAVRLALESTRLDAAIGELEKLRTEKRSGTIHLPGHRPQFSELVEQYKDSAVFLSKKANTRRNETLALKRLVEHLGGTRIDWIKEAALTSFRDIRAKDGVSNRTINIDVGAFNNAMRYAVESGLIKIPPKVKKLKESKPPRRPLLTREQIDSILANANASKNEKQFALYVRFLVATGTREQEALKVRKTDVDMQREVIRIGADGDTKSTQGRDIQFNVSLRTVLQELMSALPGDTQWLFPSPQRGEKDIHAKTFKESLRLVRLAAGVPWVGFHDFRHYFASQCVMAGLDFMTIAKWLGHQDGGMLVGKVYGHLNDAHQKAAADKLSLL